MTNKELLEIAEKKLKLAQKSYDNGIHRKGVTAEEISNLIVNLDFAKEVYKMIEEKKNYEDWIKSEISLKRAYGTWQDDYELEE